jgi:hypothetical protein
MTISKDSLRCKLVEDNISIEQVISFNYVRCKITSPGRFKEEVRQQSNTGAVISGHLKQTIWENKHLSIDCKTRNYNGMMHITGDDLRCRNKSRNISVSQVTTN